MNGKLNPQGTATRAQVAALLQRLCKTWDILPQDSMAGRLDFAAVVLTHEHKYVYISNDDSTHTLTCECGYSRVEICEHNLTEADTTVTSTCDTREDSFSASKISADELTEELTAEKNMTARECVMLPTRERR